RARPPTQPRPRRARGAEPYPATAEPPQPAGDPLRGRPAVGVVRRARRDGWDAQKVGELSQQAVGVHRVHGARNLDDETAGRPGTRAAPSQRPESGYIRAIRTTASYELLPDAPSERAMARARSLVRG